MNVQVANSVKFPKKWKWSELWLKEDWWSIWLGFGIVLIAL
jgi:hypothetical protein